MDQRRRHACPAADEHLEVGQPGARDLRRGKDLLEKRGGARHVSATLGRHQFDRRRGIPGLHQDGGGAGEKRTLERVDGTADVRDR